ncbi:MAG TPA: glutathione S-transferase N-terminal domain-containing protein [Azospirillaceae bacterium]|nr:glutathione S-transferase N-terminal domain-containing protein [Azospirillaceae bacterium]
MMKLHHSPTSPFVRKVMMVAIEAGVADRVETLPTDAWASKPDHLAHNPLSKVPALVLEDDTCLYDSPVICEYLDSLNRGVHLFPAMGPARWTALRQMALADGMCDAAVLRLKESMRSEGERSPSWIERQKAAVARAVEALEAEADGLAAAQPTIGTLAIMAALGYLDLRYKAEDWRQGHPKLLAWFDRASDRDSFRLTAPVSG